MAKRWFCVEAEVHGSRRFIGRVEATPEELREAVGPWAEINTENGSCVVFSPPPKVRVLSTNADIDPCIAEVLAAKQRAIAARGCPLITGLSGPLVPGEGPREVIRHRRIQFYPALLKHFPELEGLIEITPDPLAPFQVEPHLPGASTDETTL